MSIDTLVTIREYELEDKNFIYASFLRGLYYGDSWFSLTNKDSFMAAYHRVLDSLFSRAMTQISVACLKEDKNVILGYSIFTPGANGTTLHWIFVKRHWRGKGIARSLSPVNIVAVTHLTKTGKAIKPKDVVFDPFLL